MKTIVKIITQIFNYIKNNTNKKQLIIFGGGLLLILVGFLSWNVYYSKYYIFLEEEKKLLDTVKNYYFYHPEYLPKEGSIKTITLEKLYEDNRIEELNIPNTKEICDLDSWVRVYNDNGNYIYNTYLKCGKYKTKVDHTGPEITLNGEDTIYISLNQEYQELGVKEVKDNKDGKMDVSSVVIDNSKVNTKKVGTYEVSYKVKDKLNNPTVVIRTVNVVRNLTTTIRETTDESNYYKGQEVNNYLLFSGMMYRIIRVNTDGTILIISDENLNNLRMDSDTYEDSNIDKFLNDVYLKNIHDDSYLTDTEFCVGNTNTLTDVSGVCSKKIKRKVALLDIPTLQNTIVDSNSYLISPFVYQLSSKENKNNIGVVTGTNYLNSFSNAVLLSIRPVMTLKNDLIVTAGNGSYDNPYKIDDYKYGKTHDNINTRLIGEYVNYSGTIYRIMNITKDKEVTLISIDGITKKEATTTSNKFLTTKVPQTKKYKFNLTSKDNPGYILNDNYVDYVNDTHIVEKKYKIPTNIAGKKYNEYSTNNVTARLVLPKTYDLFAGRQKSAIGYLYLYLDNSKEENNVYFMNTQDSIIYDDVKNNFGEYCLKIVITINGDLKIKSGKGTVNKPYYIR